MASKITGHKDNLHSALLHVMFMINILSIIILTLVTSSNAFGQSTSPCTNFTVVFSSPVPAIQEDIRLGRLRIGRVQGYDDPQQQALNICIATKNSGEIEEGTVFYLSKESLIVYNIWSTGKDMPAQSSFPGFHNKYSLFLYEITLLINSFF